MKPTLLIVDDEPGIVETMKSYFSSQYQILTARCGQEAIQTAEKQPDLILLDINMPDLDELAARIAVHLRREQRRNRPSNLRFFGECAVDYSVRTVTVHGENAPLSRREFDILELLSLNPGQVFDRERIIERP